jgi:hypothetical protein
MLETVENEAAKICHGVAQCVDQLRLQVLMSKMIAKGTGVRRNEQ